jgi:hypothetical protein
VSSVRLDPQLPQNLNDGGFTWLQTAHALSTGEPHWPQNLNISGLSNWHFGHFIASPFREAVLGYGCPLSPGSLVFSIRLGVVEPWWNIGRCWA